MSLLYSNWIQRNDRVNWYGLQGRIRKEFSGWTLHSGSVYKTTWPPTGQTYTISSVTENGTALTYYAGVPNAAGKWYHDRSVKPNVLYVWCSGSAHPNSKTIVGEFTARFCSGIPYGKLTADLNSVPWRPCLSEDNAPVLEHSLGSIFYGTAVYGTINIVLTNADKFFDIPYADWLWKDSEFDFIHGDGGIEMTYAEHYAVTFVCSAITAREDSIELTLENNISVLSQPVLSNYFDIATYPNMDKNLQGQWIPELYGWMRIPFFPINMATGKFKGVNHGVSWIDFVEVQGELVPLAQWTRDITHGEITITTKVQNVTLTARPVDTDFEQNVTHYVRVAALIRRPDQNKERDR